MHTIMDKRKTTIIKKKKDYLNNSHVIPKMEIKLCCFVIYHKFSLNLEYVKSYIFQLKNIKTKKNKITRRT